MRLAGYEEAYGPAPDVVGLRAGKMFGDEGDVARDVPRDSKADPGSPGGLDGFSGLKRLVGVPRPRGQAMVKPLLEANAEVCSQRQDASRGAKLS